jgi:hypothetical protein
MRIAPIAIAILICATGLTLVAPAGSAFGWCSAYLDNGPGDTDCGGYALCIGYRWDSNGFWCQHPVPPPPPPCDIFTCGPGPILA